MGTFFSSLRRLWTFPPSRRANNRTHHLTGERDISHCIPEPTPLAPYAGNTSRLFALIVGINSYPNCRKLRGAVADAEALKDYLQEDLGVSENRIRVLLDAQATREAIIQAFRDIRKDRRIRNGDPILVFFAGHGSELRAPKAWSAQGIKGNIQCLLPYDYKATIIPPIPDRTIGALIDEVARAKGDNITVIFDCCFAAGGTRYDILGDEDEYMPRTVGIDVNILEELDLDHDILGDRYGGIPDSFEHQGTRSHILLAACGERELAYENRSHGLFTRALLATLKGRAVNTLTYAEAIDNIHLETESQKPRCLGINQQRVFFDGRVPVGAQVRYPTLVDHAGNFVVRAGLAHGVSSGVEFTLYNSQGQILGIVVIDGSATIRDFKTILAVPGEHFGNAETASLTRVGEVSFYLAQGRSISPFLKDTLQRMADSRNQSKNIRIIDRAKDAKLEIVTLENGRVVFGILDEWMQGIGLTKLPHVVTQDTVAHVLDAAAHYYWYLHHPTSSGDANHHVTINFHGLGKEYDDEGNPNYFPVDSGLCRKDMYNSDVVDFIVERNKPYGVSIANHTERDLYLNAFLFNGSSLSIVPYYIQLTAGRPEAPLKQDGILTIGYGNTGQAPFHFWLDKGQKVDVGYLKIFFATRPINLTHILQDSPFKNFGKRHKAASDAREGGPTEVEGVKDLWFTKVIPVIQRTS